MCNNYEYVDADYQYTDSQTGVLKNLADITDADDLLFVESAAVSKRTKELLENPIKIKNSNTLLEINKYLFQDIYDWAGKKRTVEISKAGKQFFPTTYFDNAFVFIDSLIEKYREIDKNNIADIAKKLAEILDTVNFLHPFREGNGRTQREFIRLLAQAFALAKIGDRGAPSPPHRREKILPSRFVIFVAFTKNYFILLI